MRRAKHPAKSLNPAEDLTQLLIAVEAATRDTSLLALNMALEGASAGAGATAQLADAVGSKPAALRGMWVRIPLRAPVVGPRVRIEESGFVRYR